jgi:hypothetical protein
MHKNSPLTAKPQEAVVTREQSMELACEHGAPPADRLHASTHACILSKTKQKTCMHEAKIYAACTFVYTYRVRLTVYHGIVGSTVA